MNKLIFALLLGLLLAACKDTPKAATDAPVSATQAPVVSEPEIASPEALQQTSTNLTTNLKTLEDFRSKVDNLPAKVKKERATEIAGIYGTVEGLMVKQGEMLKQIKASTAPASEQTDVNPAVDVNKLKDYTDAAARYAKDMQLMQEAFDNMTASAKKQ